MVSQVPGLRRAPTRLFRLRPASPALAWPQPPGQTLMAGEDEQPLPAALGERSRQLRISRQTLHRIFKGTHGITPEMAVRLGKSCGNGPGLWLRMRNE